MKRGWPGQRQQREADRATRCRAVAFERWARGRGFSRRAAAEPLRVPVRTLARWRQGWRADRLTAHPRGRSSHRGDVQARNAAIHLMLLLGPRTGLATLRAACRTLARGELQDLQRRFRRLWRREHRRLLRVLCWHRPGTVWAMDHSEPPGLIDGRWPHILAVRDLAGRMQLAWFPVASEDGRETCQTLERLFRHHGPPLVLKSDNGSAFVGDDLRKLLLRWDVTALFSPPCTPQYNGACEAGNSAMKTRTQHQAILHGRPRQWSAADLESARAIANHLHRPWGHCRPTSGEVWRQRAPITAEDRAAFGRALRRHQEQLREQLGYPKGQALGAKAQRQLNRLAISRACVECGLLAFTRRSITTPIKTRF